MIPEDLQARLRNGEVIPFVGAGVSRAVRDRNGAPLFPGWRELLLHAADRLKREGKDPDAQIVQGLLEKQPPHFLEAARWAHDGLGPLWSQFLQQEIGRRFEDADPESLALARAVWQLGNLFITTNYDMVLQWAAPDPLARDLDFWDIEAKVEQAHLLRSGKSFRPIIWHLHGRIGNTAEIILTPKGYQRLYGEDTERQYRAALRTFQTLVTTRSLLFIGFSFDDEALDAQLSDMNELFAGAPGPHYALVRTQDVGRLRSLELPIEPIPFADFSEPLLALVRELGEIAKQGSPAAGPAGLPVEARSPGVAYSTDNRPFFVPFRPKGDRVIGAEQALRRVHDQLTQGRNTSIGQTAAFEGLGGLGKTQLAVEYAWRYGDEYPNGVIWLTADQDMSAQLTRLAVDARWVAPESEHKVKLDVAQHRVRSYSDCLVIFDNIEDIASIEPYLPLPSAHPHLLGTSRTEQRGFVPVPLDILDEQHSLELLISEAGRAPVGDEEEAAAREIARELGGLPLALEMAGAYLLCRPVRWQQYRDLLRNNPKETFRSRHLSSFTRHEADLFATLRIQEELFDAEPHLREILNVLTWSSSAAMGLSLLAAVSNVGATHLLGALSLGVKLRLIESSSEEDRYGLHRLVRKVRQEDHPLSGASVWAEEVCRRLGDWFFSRRQNFADLDNYEAEIDHLHKWREHAASLSSPQASRLTWLIAYPPFHRGQYLESRKWLDQAISLFGVEANSDQVLEAWLLNDLGTIASLEGNQQRGLEFQERALSIRRNVLGEEHPDTAMSFSNLGANYLRLGDSGRALDFSNRALAVRRKILGEEHPDTALSLFNIGGIYWGLGDTQQALILYTQALTIQRKVLGEEHPNTADSLTQIGSLYDDLGDFDNALAFHAQALDILRKVFGEDHPSTADALFNLGESYDKREDKERALEYYLKALTIKRKVLGEEHPTIATYLDRVRGIYFAAGKYAQALECAELALVILKKVWGEGHESTVVAVIKLAEVLRRLNRIQDALNLVAPYVQRPPKDPEQARPLKKYASMLKSNILKPGFRPPPGVRKGKPKKRRR